MRRAFTLLEVMVASALGLLILGIAIQLFIPATRLSILGAVRVELQQQSVIGLGKMVQDLRRTEPGGVSLRSSAPVVLCVNPLSDVSGTGVQVWSTEYVLYFWQPGTTRIVRRVWRDGTLAGLSSSTARPKRVTPIQLERMATAPPQPDDRVVCQDVLSFQVADSVPGNNTLEQPITLTLELQKRDATGRPSPETFSLVRKVFVRGQR